MEHLLLKAVVTATDQGTFNAVISTASLDRDGDIVEPTAMLGALRKWAERGKLVPLAWNHSTEVVGHIDPNTAAIQGDEVVASGYVDQSIPRGEETWRLVKSGTLSFSFGYLVPEGGAEKLAGGRYRFKAIDVYEVSAIPVGPANNDTRVLSWKSMKGTGPQAMADKMRAMADEMESDSPPDPAAMARQMRAMADEMAGMGKSITELQALGEQLARQGEQIKALEEKSAEVTDKEPSVRSVDTLRKQAEAVALEIATGGKDLSNVQVEQPAKKEPELSLRDLKRRSYTTTIQVMSGDME